ncbi:oligosaccharide flippase family protein [Levilactobacillus brevis]|uniref:lipopolysaccharide biosynthesis protein n=1 Tax=Levilactobacillus brevis TaxID=1580 RepID=UPI0032E4A315
MKQRKIGAILSYTNIVAKNLVNFLYTPFLLRTVGQANYGLFQMTNSVMISLTLLSMGFSSAYVKFYVSYKVKKDEKNIKKLNALYMLVFSGISIISLLIGFIIILNANGLFGRTLSKNQLELAKNLMIIMVFDVALAFISSVFDSNITVNEHFVFQQSRQLMQTFLVPIICIPMILGGIGVLSIEITQIMVTILFFLINVNYCIRKLNMRFDFSELPIQLLKDVALFSFFIFLNQIVDLINNNVPNFILGVFQGAKMVATFAIAVQIKNMFFMLSTSLSSIFIPKINKLVNQGKSKKALTNFMIKVGRMQMSVLFFVLGGFIVVGKYFVLLWAGRDNMEAYFLIIIMVLPAVIPLSQNVGIEIQRAMNMHVFRSIVYIFFALVNIIVTVFGSIKWGVFGASLGYVISILGANGVLMNWYYYKRMKLDMIRYWKETLKVSVPFVVITTIMLLGQLVVPISSIMLFLLFGVLYVVGYITVYLFFSANSYEKGLLHSFFKIW